MPLTDLSKIVIPMIRQIIPGKIAAELVSVQPMTSATSILPTLKLNLPFEVERGSATNSDGVKFSILIFEDAGKATNDPRLLGVEIVASYQEEEKTVYKETFTLSEFDNGFAITTMAIADITQHIDEITIGSDISEPRVTALINGVIERLQTLHSDMETFALAVTKHALK